MQIGNLNEDSVNMSRPHVSNLSKDRPAKSVTFRPRPPALGFFSVGQFAVGQFAVKNGKKKPN